MRASALVMLLATLAFAARVAGQALQRFAPRPWLPPFDRWQGSALSYPTLLGAQCAILAVMAWTAALTRQGSMQARRGAMGAATILGALYLAGALARIAIGAFVPAASAWFRAWIPGCFHVVLATFVLALGGYHAAALRETRKGT